MYKMYKMIHIIIYIKVCMIIVIKYFVKIILKEYRMFTKAKL